MIGNTARELEQFFLSYERILEKLKLQKIKTKNEKEITHTNLRKAIEVMEKRHSLCRWKTRKIKSKRHYILIEGYYWLIYVYFQDTKSLLDADIEFFLIRIKQYEDLLSIERKNFFEEDMSINRLMDFFKRKDKSIREGIRRMNIDTKGIYRYTKENQVMISKDGIRWLCENCFKKRYLEILEQYKMELTEKYIAAGYIYDNFLNIF